MNHCINGFAGLTAQNRPSQWLQHIFNLAQMLQKKRKKKIIITAELTKSTEEFKRNKETYTKDWDAAEKCQFYL